MKISQFYNSIITMYQNKFDSYEQIPKEVQLKFTF